MANSEYPLRHLSVRVPWHDAGWNGTVCNAPQLNGDCVKLKNISADKDELNEEKNAGKFLNKLDGNDLPPCTKEGAAFMAGFDMDYEKSHPSRYSPYHEHLQPTLQHHPKFSVPVVPFRWMLQNNFEEFQEELRLDVDEIREPSNLPYTSAWANEANNQRALLDGFSAHLQKEDSLCFFYAPYVPFIERTDDRYILVGVGRVKEICDLTEFDMHGDGAPSLIWERPIQHSIRPEGHSEEGDGFLMPYHEIIRRANKNPSIELETYTAFTPAERKSEFSYGSEHVTHDGAIAALLSMENKLRLINEELGIDTTNQQQWIHNEFARLWKLRGPFPGLGAVLCAFGFSRGVFIAQELQALAGENEDPWPQVDRMFNEPHILGPGSQGEIKDLKSYWEQTKQNDTRYKFLRLLSCFQLSIKQAKAIASKNTRQKGITEAGILENPYRIFEISRGSENEIHFLTVDKGIFQNGNVQNSNPLIPSELNTARNRHRIRAFAIASLEKAASEGHTLQSSSDLADSINSFVTTPKCEVTPEFIESCSDKMAPNIIALSQKNDHMLQLERYGKIRELISKNVLGRLEADRHVIEQDWDSQLTKRFKPVQNEREERARKEQVQALTELAESRFSVLVGPAGTGKTAILGVLCKQPKISNNGLLLLAPTGKARVLIQQEVKGTQPQTIAQFLNSLGHYDIDSRQYLLGCPNCADGYGTVIIDEASMLTEDMLGALLNALQGVKRLILVGDPAQLPPIGAGRPFVDIVRHVENGPGYAELNIGHRQKQSDNQTPDMSIKLARWFGSKPPMVNDDEVFIGEGASLGSNLRFVEWDNVEDFQGCLTNVLTEELDLKGPDDQQGFDLSLGGNSQGYFNRGEAVKKIEYWQILSPLRGLPYGVNDINRQIHKRFRTKLMKGASQYGNIPRPLGTEQIIYGDKVINQANRSKITGHEISPPYRRVTGYLANGEIGIAVGQWRTEKMKKQKIKAGVLKVEFASQRGYTYEFRKKDFSEWGDSFLELAYALTIHKAQGSQFNKVILVLPENHRIISRELLYTALTRHQNRVIIMHQGPIEKLKELSSWFYSETARRNTNLFTECKMLEFRQDQDKRFMQEGLIHRTSNGLAVRSKSELSIAQALESAGVAFKYEKPLRFGASVRYPDFTIENDISGKTVYWEHLGMLDVENYRQAWEKKRQWYISNGILPVEDKNVKGHVLVTTDDKKGLDMVEIERLIKELCGG